MQVFVGPRNSKAGRLVVFQDHGREYRDHLDTDSGFAREKAIQRAAQRFALEAADLAHLDAQIVAAADAEDARADGQNDSIRFEPISCAELMSKRYEVRFHVDRILADGQPCILAGPQKSLKTSVVLDLGLSIAKAGFFLGRFKATTAATVGVMTGESGMPVIQETIQRISRAAGFDPSAVQNLFVTDRVPRFGDVRHTDALEVFIRDCAIEVLAIDPAYMCLSEENQANLAAQGMQLRQVNEVCQSNGVTLVICHHTRKETARQYEPLDLSQISGAAHAEWARQWLLLSRREPYQPGTGSHRLWLVAGGSIGHGGQWGVDVKEGCYHDEGGRYWQVDVKDSHEITDDAKDHREAAREAKQAEQLETDKAAIVRALAKLPDGETARELNAASGIYDRRFKTAIAALIQAGDVVTCEITKSNRKRPYDGFRLGDSSIT